ncbi:MAG TPA: site-specific integrase [Candidatus Sulfotelmatobacter sp.]|jgi:integrase|nr:site-specific integrase [Candidatus Sulfotelmatobacter sp.]
MATLTKRFNRDGELIGWQAKIRRQGYPPVSKTFTSEREAKDWATVTEADMVKGTYVDRSASERMTLDRAIDIFINDVVPTHKGGDIEKVRLERFKREESELCRYALSNLRTEHVEDYRDRRLEEIAPGSLCRELNLLHAVLENVRRRTGLVENPVSHVRRPKVADERDVRLSRDDEAKLLSALDTTRNPWIKPFVIVALETAMRRSELLGLLWRHVDLAQRTAHLPETKNGRGRTVPLSPRAAEALAALPRSIDGLVFPVSLESLKHAWTRARDRAGLHHLHLHDLRHEATSRLAEAGWNVLELAAVTGHQDLQMLKRYTNLRAADLAKKMS